MRSEAAVPKRTAGIKLLRGDALEAALEAELQVLKATGEALDHRAQEHGIGYLDRSSAVAYSGAASGQVAVSSHRG